uniref:Lung adenoma susceptibility protein 2 isoform X2 n=1 Tax=Geotrypetes seraphini TaxID=260995 RepID=A0A6P8PYF0_GEOSA|nr:lung adenoma susceptibility protein 2 isoform X2 [Geotrypetes seraphini]
MANLLKESTICSSASSISLSSLLASCSLGSSQSSSRSLITSIWYKEKLYESATEALEAYIKDYEGSLLSPSVSTGKISIQKTPVGSFHSRPKVSGNVDCAGDRQAFSSPFKSHLSNDLDLVSLTTDDLLAFPSDGSLPFHQASISKPVIQRNKQRRKNHKSSLKKNTSYSLFDFDRELGFQHNSSVWGKKNFTGFSPCKNVSSRTVEKTVGGDDSQAAPNSLSSKNYPRWLTSQKSDLNVSGITSIPDVKYPMWLRNSGLLSDLVDKDFTSKRHKAADSSSEQTPYGLSSMTYLDKLDSFNIFDNNKHLQSVDVEGMNEMLVFQQEDLLSSHSKEPFRDDMIELLILKTEKALESSLQGVPSSIENIGSPQTDDLVDAERSWEKIPVTFKSPVPVFCDEGMETLQTTKLNLINDFIKDSSKNDPQIEFSETESKMQLFDKEMMPVNKSLKKAMHHLFRLKRLVEDNSEEREEEKENWEKEVQSN